MIKALSISFFILLISSATLYSQQSGQVGAFDFLPQSVYANPALRPAARVNIGIPGLSQIHFGHGNNWFKPSEQLVPDANGKVVLNAENILKGIDESAYTSQSVGIELIHLGFRFGKHYVHARASERIQGSLTIPKDVFYLGVYGNAGNHNFENNTVDLSDLSIDAIHFREYGIGYNYQLNEKWSFGLTAKYLYGMERIHTEKSSLSMRTDPFTYNMQTSGGFILNTSGIYSGEDVDDIRSDIQSYLLGLKNTGFGADFGVVYRPIKKLQLEFSAIDIGFIKWKSNLATYGTDDATFAYNGIDLTEFIFMEGSDFSDAMQNKLDTLLDDLETTYNFDRSEKEFTTTLNGYLRYAGSYEVLSHEKFRGKAWLSLSHGILDSEAPITISIGYNQKLWKVIQADVHLVKRTHYSPAIGAGLSLNAGPFQIYVLAENIHFANYSKITLVEKGNPENETTLPYFHNPEDVRLNLGMNFTFGRKAVEAPRGKPMKR